MGIEQPLNREVPRWLNKKITSLSSWRAFVVNRNQNLLLIFGRTLYRK